MRKIISVLTLISILLPVIAFAQITTPSTCTLRRDMPDVNSQCVMANNPISITEYGMCCLINTIYAITDWIFYILMAFVGVMIVIGAFTIITAGGTPDNITKGRNYILYAVIGMVVAFFARAIPAIAKALVGM